MYICIYIFDKKHKRENRLYNQIRESSTEGKKKPSWLAVPLWGLTALKQSSTAAVSKLMPQIQNPRGLVFFPWLKLEKFKPKAQFLEVYGHFLISCYEKRC